jgi:type II secretory ATPase GspE/PulE/Tfp pilus assembly ATPase PilB-like protein
LPFFIDKGKPCRNGTSSCANTVYKGRLCPFELLTPNEEMRDLIAGRVGHLEFKNVAIKSGYKTTPR